MPRRGRGGAGGNIRQYLTRSSSQKTDSEEFQQAATCESEKSVPTVTKANMSGDEVEVTNAELRKLMLTIDQKMTREFSKLNETIEKLTDKVDNLEIKVDELETNQWKQQSKVENVEDKMEDLRRSLLLTQVHSRKYNLLLYGIEGYEAESEQTIEKVRTFAKESLEFDEKWVEELIIRNAHRLQARHEGPAAIIVVFTLWSDREAFLRAGKKLRNTKMSIRSDLPPELKRVRGALADEAFVIRRDEGLHTRIKEKGVDLFIETRKSVSDTWQKRKLKSKE